MFILNQLFGSYFSESFGIGLTSEDVVDRLLSIEYNKSGIYYYHFCIIYDRLFTCLHTKMRILYLYF